MGVFVVGGLCDDVKVRRITYARSQQRNTATATFVVQIRFLYD